MGTLSSLLMALAGPIAIRVLMSLGLGVVTYTGASLALTTATDAAKAAFAGMGADVLQLLAMAGVFQSLSIICGGLAGGLALMSMKKFALTATGA